MNSRKKKALVIGCGIAGPAVALFLKRAGIDSEIYEARTSSDDYSLVLSGNGMNILNKLSLSDAAAEAGSPVSRSVIVNGKGRLLGETPLSGRGQTPGVVIKRDHLGTILSRAAACARIKIECDKQLLSIERAGDGDVTAIFQDGTSASGDLLIGCDGVHSRTRQLVDPAAPGAVFRGLVNTGGRANSLNLSPSKDIVYSIYCRRAFFSYHVNSCGEIFWSASYPQVEEPASGVAMTNEQRKGRLLALFQGDAPLIWNTILASDSILTDFPSYGLPRQPVWHRGPVALAGDAAHAISPGSGQGASMALEDAATLAKCLRDIDDAGAALAAYEQLRRERTYKMFELALRHDAGKFATGTAQVWIRDLLMPFYLRRYSSPGALDWIYSYDVDWNPQLQVGTATSKESREAIDHAQAA